MGLGEVFVGDLSFFCSEADFPERFEIFRPVQNAIIKRDYLGRSLMFGFVHYKTAASAKQAIRTLHGQKFMGRSIIVHDTNSRAPKKDYSLWHKVNVYFVTFQQPQISESFLDEAFQAFGQIADIVVREHTIHSMNLASSGPSSGPSAPSTSEAST
eukprot:gene21781-26355_t